MTVKLLTEHHLEFLNLKGGCTGSSESTLVKMSNCCKCHAAAHINLINKVFLTNTSPYPADIFVKKIHDHIVCCFYSNALHSIFITEANTMNPNQTAPDGSSLIWVHLVFVIGNQSTFTEERANNNCREK